MRLAVVALLLTLCSLVIANDNAVVAEVRKLRLAGELDHALALAEETIAANDSTPQQVFDLHLEVAKIHDRFGLHNDTRPVAAALDAIHAAKAISEELDTPAGGRVQLALAEYHYRAGMAERDFGWAETYVIRATFIFKKFGLKHREAEAVHLLGLIELQRGNLMVARSLFYDSVRIDAEGGARDFFRGEYERHVGFVYSLQDKPAAALPYFERSLEYRIKAGAIDASLFAAVSLAATLADLGRGDEARPHLDYALAIADRIGSPVGRRRAEAVLARITEE